MFPILLEKNNDLEKRVKALEDSGGGSTEPYILHLVYTVRGYTTDVSYNDIYNLLFSGVPIIAKVDSEFGENIINYGTIQYLTAEDYGDYQTYTVLVQYSAGDVALSASDPDTDLSSSFDI